MRPIAFLRAVALASLSAACVAVLQTPAASAQSPTVIPLLKIGGDFVVPTLDETKTLSAGDVDAYVLDNVMNFEPNGRVQPSLATSVAQPNPLAYIYQIRKGVTFWDGDPLTAADVAYSWNYERAPGSQLGLEFAHVKSITATGPYTVEVQLDQPDAAWQYTPAEAGIFEMKFAEEHKATFGEPGTLIMGSGPFEVMSLDPSTGAVLTANPHWWGGKVPAQKVIVSFFSNQTSAALALRAGEIQFDPYVLDKQSFAKTSGAAIVSAPSCENGFFSMNTTLPGWDDVHVRRAVAYALDRSAIITAYGGYATPIATLTPPSMLLSIASQSQVNSLLNSIPLYPHNLALAKQEMAESAYPHGFSTTITEWSDESTVNIAQVIAAEIKPLGIDATVKELGTNTWLAQQSGTDSGRQASFEEGGCFNPDPSAYFLDLGSANTKPGLWNTAVWGPSSVNNLLSEAVATSDPSKRFPLFSQLFRQLQEAEPYIGAFQVTVGVAISKTLKLSNFNAWDDDYLLDISEATS